MKSHKKEKENGELLNRDHLFSDWERIVNREWMKKKGK